MTSQEGELGKADHFFASLEQGTVLEVSEEAWSGIGFPDNYNNRAVVLVSQTCDIVLSKRPTVHVAPLVAVDESEARPENPRYLSSRNFGGLQVDLSWIVPVRKDVSLFSGVGEKIADRSDERDFALGVARWFGRYPFSDEVAEWLRPLLAVIRKKYAKEQSPLGIVLQSVAEIRVSLSDWTGGPCEMTIHVIAKAGAIPEVEEVPDLDAKGHLAIRDPQGNLKPLAVVAAALVKALDDNSPHAVLYWEFFAQALAAECRLSEPFNSDRRFSDAVTAVVAELDSEDEFSLQRVRASEVLDLEYLSASERS